MKLVRSTDKGNVTLAEIQDGKVTYLHPTIQRVIDTQKCVVLPAINAITEQFGGQQVKCDHPKWAKAIKFYLNYEWVTRDPKAHRWINGELPKK